MLNEKPFLWIFMKESVRSDLHKLKLYSFKPPPMFIYIGHPSKPTVTFGLYVYPCSVAVLIR
jgi:hypothetical protein